MSQPEPNAVFEAAVAAQPRYGETGPDVAARAEEAWRLFTQAAEAGHAGAMVRLVSRRDVGLDWAIALAKLGDSSPLATELTNSDWNPAARRAVLVAAEAGEPWAQTAVGRVYGMGMCSGKVVIATTQDGFGWLPGVKNPKAEARRWFELAAAADWADALLALAAANRAADPTAALAYAQRAAGGVLTPAQREHLPVRLCDLLERAGVPLAQQLPTRQLCADQGHADSLAFLAERYQLGDGVAPDIEKAADLYQAAAERGSVAGCRELGRMYEQGLGVAVDDTKAQELYERAAELGADGFARDRLAEKYGLTWYAPSAKEKAKDAKAKGAEPAAKPKAAKPKAATKKTTGSR